MKTRLLHTTSAALLSLSLLMTLSASGAQSPASVASLNQPMDAVKDLPLIAKPDIIRQAALRASDAEQALVETVTLGDGRSLDRVVINGPPSPPPGFERPTVDVQALRAEAQAVILSEVPAYSWSYGCSATSAAMIAAYYDRTGYPSMYTGPTNGGVMPMDNSVWGSTAWPSCEGGTRRIAENPLSATHEGIDGRTSRGHVDDYWVGYLCPGPDPFFSNGWPEHPAGDCTADYMNTNKWFSPTHDLNLDGSTVFYYYPEGSVTPTSVLAAQEPPVSYDGALGFERFYESRGHAVDTAYNQLIRGRGEDPDLGFTYAQYKTEIDAGRPVMVHVSGPEGGHTMVGVGYDDTSSDLMYIHDTWDYDLHTMTWDGSYSGMSLLGVTVVQLEPASPLAPTVVGITPSNGFNTGTVHITDLSGADFQPGATVKLTKSGQSDIPGTGVTVVSPSKITCDFDLSGVATGLWNVVVTNPGPESDTLANGFAVRAPTSFAYLPLVSKLYAAAADKWVTLLDEDFEGPFPGGVWDVHDNDVDLDDGNLRYYWGKRDCRASGGSYSAWSVGAGDTILDCGDDYPPHVSAWMVYGPFSLADAAAAELSFDWWSDTPGGEEDTDRFFWGASINGRDFGGYAVPGNQSSWTTDQILDLSNVPYVGNLIGEDEAWIAFLFVSDLDMTDRGSLVDNVLLRKYVGSGAPAETALSAPRLFLEHERDREATTLVLD
jgi:hypothetical protein